MKIDLKRILFALIGIFLVGIGIAFNSSSNLGNDPIGIVYDGVRNVLSLTTEQIGTASNYVNFSLIIVLFFIGRKYVNIGTFIYIIPYGLFVNIGKIMYNQIFVIDTLLVRWISLIIGCLLLYIGVAIFIVVNIGLDPFTGLVMVLADKVKKEFRSVKIFFDIFMIILGIVLGGRLGIITIITALCAGPLIQYFSKIIQKYIRLD
jgi:uncharacterized membrane protein YczE